MPPIPCSTYLINVQWTSISCVSKYPFSRIIIPTFISSPCFLSPLVVGLKDLQTDRVNDQIITQSLLNYKSETTSFITVLTDPTSCQSSAKSRLPKRQPRQRRHKIQLQTRSQYLTNISQPTQRLMLLEAPLRAGMLKTELR